MATVIQLRRYTTANIGTSVAKLGELFVEMLGTPGSPTYGAPYSLRVGDGVTGGGIPLKVCTSNVLGYSCHINGVSDKHAAQHITLSSNVQGLGQNNVCSALEQLRVDVNNISDDKITCFTDDIDAYGHNIYNIGNVDTCTVVASDYVQTSCICSSGGAIDVSGNLTGVSSIYADYIQTNNSTSGNITTQSIIGQDYTEPFTICTSAEGTNNALGMIISSTTGATEIRSSCYIGLAVPNDACILYAIGESIPLCIDQSSINLSSECINLTGSTCIDLNSSNLHNVGTINGYTVDCLASNLATCWGVTDCCFTAPTSIGNIGEVLASNNDGTTYWTAAGAGDMIKATYDSNDDGLVDCADFSNFACLSTSWGPNEYCLCTPGTLGNAGELLATCGNGQTYWTAAGAGIGDMTQACYDSGGDGIVNCADAATCWGVTDCCFTAPTSVGNAGELLATDAYGQTYWTAAGIGDMTQACYDSGGDGIVNCADMADVANCANLANCWGVTDCCFTAPTSLGNPGELLATDAYGQTYWTAAGCGIGDMTQACYDSGCDGIVNCADAATIWGANDCGCLCTPGTLGNAGELLATYGNGQTYWTTAGAGDMTCAAFICGDAFNLFKVDHALFADNAGIDCTDCGSIALGYGATVSLGASVSLGYLATANYRAIAIGYSAISCNSIAIGCCANATCCSISIGDCTFGVNFGAAVGYCSLACEYGSAFGNYSWAPNGGSAFGYCSLASYCGSAFGYCSWAPNGGSAFGYCSLACEYGSALGYYSCAYGIGNVAIGCNANSNPYLCNFTDTAMIGTGSATYGGALHYRGVPIAHPNRIGCESALMLLDECGSPWFITIDSNGTLYTCAAP